MREIATYSRWNRPGNSATRRSPSRRTIVVSDVVVLLVGGIYMRLSVRSIFGEVGFNNVI